MDRVIIPKQLTTYAPRGRRCLGRPNKRWHETVTGHLAKTLKEDDDGDDDYFTLSYIKSVLCPHHSK
jgi:hypothetical protein